MAATPAQHIPAISLSLVMVTRIFIVNRFNVNGSGRIAAFLYPRTGGTAP